MSKADEPEAGTSQSAPNGSTAMEPLEQRYKILFRYTKLGLILLLVVGLLSAFTFYQVNSEKEIAQSNQQVQAETTINSDYCKVYPQTETCELSKTIIENPTEAVIPEDGKDGQEGKEGKTGADGRGVTKFDSSSGNLIVSYTDGQTQDLGRVVGANGKDGAKGETGPEGQDGRGIISSDASTGSLIITYSDGTTQNAGIVVGPKGEIGTSGLNGTNGQDGTPGKDGQDGTPGKDGLTPTGVNTDIYGNVTVTYSDGSTAAAGKVILPEIEIFQCTDGVLTLKLTNGPAFTTATDCTPDNLPNPPAAVTTIPKP